MSGSTREKQIFNKMNKIESIKLGYKIMIVKLI